MTIGFLESIELSNLFQHKNAVSKRNKFRFLSWAGEETFLRVTKFKCPCAHNTVKKVKLFPLLFPKSYWLSEIRFKDEDNYEYEVFSILSAAMSSAAQTL